MDTLHTNVRNAGSYIYSPGAENDCTGIKYCRTQCNVFSGWITAYCRTFTYDIRCSGCI